MLEFTIPGRGEVRATHLVLDYNGTLAKDGRLIPAALPLLEKLSQLVQVHILTGDTHGSVQSECDVSFVKIHILPDDDQDEGKLAYLDSLDPLTCIAVGNGYNDRLMLKHAALGIALIQDEGLCTATLMASDVVFTGIAEALESLLAPKRLAATLRNR